MKNLPLEFIEKLKTSTTELISIQNEIESKLISNRETENENLNDLKQSLNNIRKQLIESIHTHEKNNQNNNETFQDTLLKNLDNIKPLFEEVLNKIKMYSHNLTGAIDITTLEIKLSYIYTMIFLREQKLKILS